MSVPNRVEALGPRARSLVLGMVCLILAACESTGQPSVPTPSATPTSERWQTVPRGTVTVAAVVNASGYTLSLGCGGPGSSGRTMEVLSGGKLLGDPPEYGFTVYTGGREIFTGKALARSSDGAGVFLATLTVEAVQALRKGGAVSVDVPGHGAHRFSLAGSKAAINNSSCGV